MTIRSTLSAALAAMAALCSQLSCAYDNLDYGIPGACDQIVDRIGYALGFVDEWKQPAWVSYRLTAAEASGTYPRSDNFRADPEIVSGSAQLSDYAGSGYDRGHLSPAADNAWSALAMSESFYLSNMSPQRPGLNRGLWSGIEKAVRNFALSEGAVVIVTGPIVSAETSATIGANAVVVPEGFYKVVFAEESRKMIAFVVSQEDSGSARDHVCAVSDVELLTGLDFFSELDDDEEWALESQFDANAWVWSGAARDEDTVFEEYAVDPVAPVALSSMARGWCRREWPLGLDSLLAVYPTEKTGNVSGWENGTTVPGLQAYVDGTPLATITRNRGATTKSGFFVFWGAGEQIGEYAFGTMTSGAAGRQCFGVAFRNDLPFDVKSVDVVYRGRQFGFRNLLEQSFTCELLSTNALVAVCNGRGWRAPEGLSFASPLVGRTDLASGRDSPVSSFCGARRIPIAVRSGEYLHLRWRREPFVNGAAMGVDNVEVRFNFDGGCIVFR